MLQDILTKDDFALLHTRRGISIPMPYKFLADFPDGQKLVLCARGYDGVVCINVLLFLTALDVSVLFEIVGLCTFQLPMLRCCDDSSARSNAPDASKRIFEATGY